METSRSQSPKIRVRFPPSPTGIPHIGNTRTAFFNFLFAKHNHGDFILRIEDTDRARLVEGAEEAIKEILTWLGLTWDEYYKQSERVELYQKAARELVEKNLAREDEGAIRFIVPKGETLSWVDAIGSKHITFKSEDVEDFIILKSDGFPTYHLANIIDDHDMQISHVIRGDEWISSVPKHLLLYKAFGWEPPVFAHLPVIVGSDKSKLSKRHGADSVLQFREKGYLKEALLNYMALLGWRPASESRRPEGSSGPEGNSGEREIMDMVTMIDLFDLKDINTASPMFDLQKLEWLNGMYIRGAQSSELRAQILTQNTKLKDIDEELLDKIVPLAQSRMKTLNDFEDLVLPWFSKNEETGDADMKNDLAKRLEGLEEWNVEQILVTLKEFREAHKVNMKTIYKLLIGTDQGLPIADMMVILGKGKILAILHRT